MDLECNEAYLTVLAKNYPTIQAVSSEIINLRAILNLPKGTDHFMSDLHGEYEAFSYVIRSASGVIKTKIDDLYCTTVTERERNALATLVYYPKQKLYHLHSLGKIDEEWYKLTLYRLIELCRVVSSKYTRSKVRKAMPTDFAYILDEFLNPVAHDGNKHNYYNQIMNSIIDIGRADDFIIALATAIKRLSVDHLHIIGDIFDRGPRADMIMDELLNRNSVDIQWGNHDIVWIGASAGHMACIANVIRNSLHYNNFDVIEIGYGINTRTLANFAFEHYADDECIQFMPLDSNKRAINNHEATLAARMHKAITIIQFKLEGQIIKNHPEYKMEDRMLLDKIDIENKTVTIDGKQYRITDTSFPTIDFNNPYALTADEENVIKSLRRSFLHSSKLQEHIRFLINNGGMYKIYNGNLLYHGCIPLNKNGQPDKTDILGKELSGKEFLDEADKYVRHAYNSRNDFENDFCWYLWCGSKSPLFGKDKMCSFESYFTNEESLLKETKNYYYSFIESIKTCDMLLDEFGLNKSTAHIINGHVPVKTSKGESPIKAGGKLYVIDGGLSKPYQKTTGIAGYTLINNSYGISITAHRPFPGINDVIENDTELHSEKTMVELHSERKMVCNTDTGVKISKKIDLLKTLLEAYQNGYVCES